MKSIHKEIPGALNEITLQQSGLVQTER
jgi:hypothetical protein